MTTEHKVKQNTECTSIRESAQGNYMQSQGESGLASQKFKNQQSCKYNKAEELPDNQSVQIQPVLKGPIATQPGETAHLRIQQDLGLQNKLNISYPEEEIYQDKLSASNQLVLDNPYVGTPPPCKFY